MYGNLFWAGQFQMRVIKSVLKEELANSLAMEKSYERELAKLPKGSLVRKTIKGHEYYYLQVRENGKVRFLYKGKLSAQEIEQYKQTKRYRAQYRKLLAGGENNLDIRNANPIFSHASPAARRVEWTHIGREKSHEMQESISIPPAAPRFPLGLYPHRTARGDFRSLPCSWRSCCRR